MRIKTETIQNLEKIRSGKIVWPLTRAQTKALMALVLVVAGLVLLSHIVKIIDDGSKTTGQATPDEVEQSSTGNEILLFFCFCCSQMFQVSQKGIISQQRYKCKQEWLQL